MVGRRQLQGDRNKRIETLTGGGELRWIDAGGETHVDVEEESLRWKQTLTFNAL